MGRKDYQDRRAGFEAAVARYREQGRIF